MKFVFEGFVVDMLVELKRRLNMPRLLAHSERELQRITHKARR